MSCDSGNPFVRGQTNDDGRAIALGLLSQKRTRAILQQRPLVHKELFVMKRAYETMYILRPDMGEEMADQVITKYQGILKDNGVESIDTQHRGKRRLAYEIQKHKEGIYIQMNYEAEPAAVAAMERDMRFSEDIIRFLTMRQDELQSDPSTPVSL